jgi:glutathione S-transferase
MKLYRFRYSPYARKVQMLLDLLGRRYEVVEVPYSDRAEIATVTGGYAYVPVLVEDDGHVTVDSRAICERLVAGAGGQRLVPPRLAGPVWAYADFSDGGLEDVLFRIASPAIRDAWASASDQALYIIIKERKFGAGCISSWERDRDGLVTHAQHLLAPTLTTLDHQPLLFGAEPTLADAALYGNLAMLDEAEPQLVMRVSPLLRAYMRRLEAVARERAPS